MKKICGLIGFPLEHSFSKSYFDLKFSGLGVYSQYEYRNFPIGRVDLLPELIADTPGLFGLNVTAPYKKSVIPFLDALSDTARAVGAVNCIVIERGNSNIGVTGGGCRLIGHNTDAPGFLWALRHFLDRDAWDGRALILGSGGAAAAAAHALRQAGIEYKTVSRQAANMLTDNALHATGTLTYDKLDARIIESHRLIINATPLGTWPDTDCAPPIPYEHLTSDHYLFDMVYNPSETLFMLLGRARGARTTNGLSMLRAQADLAWDIWRSTI